MEKGGKTGLGCHRLSYRSNGPAGQEGVEQVTGRAPSACPASPLGACQRFYSVNKQQMKVQVEQLLWESEDPPCKRTAGLLCPMQ